MHRQRRAKEGLRRFAAGSVDRPQEDPPAMKPFPRGVWSSDFQHGAAGAFGRDVVRDASAAAEGAPPGDTSDHEVEIASSVTVRGVCASCDVELPAGSAHLLETPFTYAEVHAGSHVHLVGSGAQVDGGPGGRRDFRRGRGS